MQLAVHYDRLHLPSHIGVCETTARAVVALLTDARAVDGEWRPCVQHWTDGRIRKIVRRAKGVRWTEVEQLPGVTVCDGPAHVRAFVPGPVDQVPIPLAKCQVRGTELPDTAESNAIDALVTLTLSPFATMTTGKAAAQCGHAAQLILAQLGEETRQRWMEDGFRVRVVRVGEKRWEQLRSARVSVLDAGLTELDGPTETVRATWSLR